MGATEIIIIIFIVIVIVVFVLSGINKEDQPVTNTDNRHNKIVNVTLNGGIIGMLASSPQSKLNDRIRLENQKGWKVIQIIPADSGNIFLLIFRLLLLMITFTLFTTANGYYLILERMNIANHDDYLSKMDKSTVATSPQIVEKTAPLSEHENEIINKLRSQLKPNEVLVMFKFNKEYKILKREQYKMDKELHINNDYKLIDENI